MQAIVFPSSVHGTVRAPASKSLSQRAIAAALLANGRSVLHHVADCDDVRAAIDIATALGADIFSQGSDLLIDGHFSPRSNILNCCESGLCMRMFAAIAALHTETLTLTGTGSLRLRPLGMDAKAFEKLGVTCTANNGFLPLCLKGPLQGGAIVMDASLSSQWLTGLLMALPLVAGDTEITVTDLKSKPYIDITMELLAQFGISIINKGYEHFYIKGGQQYAPVDYTVEGDWSGAAFLLVAGALNGGASVNNLRADSLQADKLICEALQLAGANVYVGNTCVVKKKDLDAFTFDATDCPDLFPPLVALAAHCRGTTTLRGAHRLKHKESDRATALQQEFGKLGVKITVTNDVMNIEGGTVQGGVVRSHGDHRIAMALATTAVAAASHITIEDADCIDKSYPGLFHDFKILNISCHYE